MKVLILPCLCFISLILASKKLSVSAADRSTASNADSGNADKLFSRQQPDTPGFDTEKVAFSPLPLPVSGTCNAGVAYKIESLSDLYNLIPDIDCIWGQGLAPNKVPLGAGYGKGLTVLNSAYLGFAMTFLYRGDYLLQTRCNDNYYNIATLMFTNLPVSPGIATISPLPEKYTVAEGEAYDGGAGLVLDFTTSVPDFCPYEGDEAAWSPLNKGFLPFGPSVWPANLLLDMFRAVGRDEDGCLILVGRTWLLDPTPPHYPLYTILFVSMKTCDPEVLPDFLRGDSLPAIAETYSYHRGGAKEALERLAPWDYLLNKNNQTNGVFDYSTYGNTDTQPIAGGGTSLTNGTFTNNENADPHDGVALFIANLPSFIAKLLPDQITTAFEDLAGAVLNSKTSQ